MTEESKEESKEEVQERAELSKTKRVVIKIGTNVLMTQQKTEKAEKQYSMLIHEILSQVSTLMKKGIQVVLVSSGSIGLGARELQLEPPIKDIRLRQISAALGQPILMELYRSIGREFSLTCAQILVTRNDFNIQRSYVTVKRCLNTLLDRNVIPIINENDSVSTEEIDDNFGDNDQLSAMIASKIEADLLIILTDIDALYTKNPRKNKDVQRLSLVQDVNPLLKEQKDADTGTNYGTGGMYTKLKAASITQQVGCKLCIASAFEENVLLRIIDGESIGTLFPAQNTIQETKRWMLHARTTGHITLREIVLDSFVKSGKFSADDIVEMKNDFAVGEVLTINKLYKCVALLSSADIRAIQEQEGKDHMIQFSLEESIVKQA